jgi:hypothetical protein
LFCNFLVPPREFKLCTKPEKLNCLRPRCELYEPEFGHSRTITPPQFDPSGNQEESLADDQILDRNCSGCEQCCMDYEGWLQFQQALYRIVRDPLFELAITVCIVLNTMFLAMEHHGMSDDVLRALDVGNKVSGARDGRLEPPHCPSFQVFTSIFTFECCLKLMALSKEFFYCGWNIFDLIIVSASVLDLIFELVDGLSVLRGLRLVSEGSPPDHSDSYRVASS